MLLIIACFLIGIVVGIVFVNLYWWICMRKFIKNIDESILINIEKR